MHALAIFIVVFWLVHVQADLTCLGWGLISPIVGLFCHFEPEYFQKAENDTVAAVQDAIQSTEDLVQFDLTHNPAVITYDFLEKTSHKGLGQGGKYLQNVSTDFGDVTIGFGKDTANQLVTIMELSYWNDVSMCLISGAGGLVTQEKRKRFSKRATVPSVNDAVSMAQNCVSQKFKQIANPATFQIKGTNQEIGSTMSNLAGLLVPVGVEEKAAINGAEALEGAVDLAIPGSESTTRVVKKVGENTADHFANEAEANAVAGNMKNEAWVDENCGVCEISLPPLGNGISRRKTDSAEYLRRRGVSATPCCTAGSVPPGQATVQSPDETDYQERRGFIHNPAEYRFIKEADLVPAPQLTIRDINNAEDMQDLSKDLDAFSTGLVKWPSQLIDEMYSDQVLTTLREIFIGSPRDSLYQALRIRERDGGLRKSCISNNWMNSNYPPLQPLKEFVSASIDHGQHVVAGLKNLNPDDLEGEIQIFYTPPNPAALTGIDPRGFHIDGGLMQFGIADVPGLVVSSTATGKASRLPIEKNAWQLLKARFWDIQAWYKQTPQGPTWHSVFGPEMAEKGRVSMIMTIYTRKVKEW